MPTKFANAPWHNRMSDREGLCPTPLDATIPYLLSSPARHDGMRKELWRYGIVVSARQIDRRPATIALPGQIRFPLKSTLRISSSWS